jgi:hypothetical protein
VILGAPSNVAAIDTRVPDFALARRGAEACKQEGASEQTTPFGSNLMPSLYDFAAWDLPHKRLPHILLILAAPHATPAWRIRNAKLPAEMGYE